jgi:hypothetical protein
MVAWSYEDIIGIYPRIIVHEIKTYPEYRVVRKRLCPTQPQKVIAIKAEVQKLLNVGFIYLVSLTEWVSNIMLVAKKKGMI